jgi:hypothetical protein
MNTRVYVECGAPAASEEGVALCPACALRAALDHAGEVQAFQRSAVRASGMYASGAAAVMLGYDRSAETLALMRPVTDSDDGFAVVGRAYLLLAESYPFSSP